MLTYMIQHGNVYLGVWAGHDPVDAVRKCEAQTQHKDRLADSRARGGCEWFVEPYPLRLPWPDNIPPEQFGEIVYADQGYVHREPPSLWTRWHRDGCPCTLCVEDRNAQLSKVGRGVKAGDETDTD
jgi:hypothetical protein